MLNEEMTKYKLLGRNIAYYRQLRGFTQNKLAEQLNISRTHMGRIETAKCAASLDIIFRICDILSISEKNLFEFHDICDNEIL